MTTKLDEIREEQRVRWNKFAPGWKKWDPQTMKWMSPVGAALLAGVKPGMTVLDVATGTGEPGLSAAKTAAKVVATDLSEVMVEIANENAKAKGLKNFEAKAADVGALPFKDATFDAVICRFGIMFFPDPVAGAREMARVAKPGASLAYAVWAPGDKNPWISMLAKLVFDTLGLPHPPKDAPGIFRFAERGSATRVLEAAGLGNVSETPVDGTLTFASPEEYWEMMTEIAAPVAGALAKASPADAARIRAMALEAAGTFRSGDAIVFPWQAYIVTAAK